MDLPAVSPRIVFCVSNYITIVECSRCSECDYTSVERGKLKRHMLSHMRQALKKRQEEQVGRPKPHK